MLYNLYNPDTKSGRKRIYKRGLPFPHQFAQQGIYKLEFLQSYFNHGFIDNPCNNLFIRAPELSLSCVKNAFR
jgi:hypothetical protein